MISVLTVTLRKVKWPHGGSCCHSCVLHCRKLSSDFLWVTVVRVANLPAPKGSPWGSHDCFQHEQMAARPQLDMEATLTSPTRTQSVALDKSFPLCTSLLVGDVNLKLRGSRRFRPKIPNAVCKGQPPHQTRMLRT